MKILKRLKEPSTWAGLGALAAIFTANPLVPAAIMKVGAAVGAIAAILLPEASA